MKYCLMNYQLEVLNNIEYIINNSTSHISVNMPAGSGKTVIMMCLAKKLLNYNKKILITYDYVILKEQLNEKIKDFELDNQITLLSTRSINCLEETYDYIITDSLRVAGRRKISELIRNSKTRVISFFDSNQEIQSTGINWKYIDSFKSEHLIFSTTEVIDVRDAKYLGKIDLAFRKQIESKIKDINEKCINSNNYLKQIELENEKAKNKILEKQIVEQRETIKNYKNMEIFYNYFISSLGVDIRVVNDLYKKINSVKNCVFERLQSKDECVKEIALKELQDRTSELVLKVINSMISIESSNYYEQILIGALNIEVWNKLDDTSKKFLVTAKSTYECMIKMADNESLDYSGVCLLMTKALEVETTNRFFSKYAQYLNSNNISISAWPNSMKKIDRNTNRISIIDVNEYTLGSVCYTVGYKFDNNNDCICINDNNKSLFIRFFREELFDSNSNVDLLQTIINDISIVQKVRIDYRNPAAHKAPISLTTAKECMDYMIDVQCAIKDILSSMKI